MSPWHTGPGANSRVTYSPFLAELGEFEIVPGQFGERVQRVLASLGMSSLELQTAVAHIETLLRESIMLAGPLYTPRFPIP